MILLTLMMGGLLLAGAVSLTATIREREYFTAALASTLLLGGLYLIFSTMEQVQ